MQALLEFGMCVVTPLNKGDQQQIENAQTQPTKVVNGCKNINYLSRLNKLKLPTLVDRRLRREVIMTYKLWMLTPPVKIYFILMNALGVGGIVRICPRRGKRPE